MKNQTQNYIDKEEAVEIQPIELFHFWRTDNGEHWRYTSRDEDIDFKGNTFLKGPINRGSITYNPDIDVSQVDIMAVFSDDPFIKYIAQNPIDPVWVEIIRVHKDLQNEGSILFIGQISKVGFSGQNVSAQAVSFEFFLKHAIPTTRYQPKCNHFVYDDIVDGFGCGIDRTPFLVQTQATVSGLILTSSDFGNQVDGYFKHGWVEFGDEKRMVSDHTGNNVTIRYAFSEVIPSIVTVNIYPGCNGAAETCRDKFSNIAQFGGHLYIPADNPAAAW